SSNVIGEWREEFAAIFQKALRRNLPPATLASDHDMGKLNYDKWNALEVSDDSDIEGHPNVDHASLVRWKQRDIHEKREARKFKIAQYEQEIKNNDILYPKIQSKSRSSLTRSTA
ncbi:6111_t:CDS:2, partial [Acaulospora colombiana]